MKNLEIWTSKYFYGNEISKEGQENGFVDYATLAKAFEHVMNNDLRANLESVGYEFTIESGFVDNSEEIEKIEEELEELEDKITTLEDEEEGANLENKARINEDLDELYSKRVDLEDEKDELERTQGTTREIFQEFIITSPGAEILEEMGEIVFYCDVLDLYIWGVDHWGTSWDYVPTNIKLELDKD